MTNFTKLMPRTTGYGDQLTEGPGGNRAGIARPTMPGQRKVG